MTAAQIRPVGPHPDTAVLLIGSLLWASPASKSPEGFDTADVLRMLHDDDVADPATATVLAAVRRLSESGQSGPQLVYDELRRLGEFCGDVPERLQAAVTSGATPEQARPLAAAVVADSLRRRVESAGAALSSAAVTAVEAALAPMVATAAATVADAARRLDTLRGEAGA